MKTYKEQIKRLTKEIEDAEKVEEKKLALKHKAKTETNVQDAIVEKSIKEKKKSKKNSASSNIRIFYF